MVEELKLHVEVAELPEMSVILLGLQDAVKPTAGLTVLDSVSVPLKPFRLVSVIVDVPDEPTGKVTVDGAAVILKSMMLTVI